MYNNVYNPDTDENKIELVEVIDYLDNKVNLNNIFDQLKSTFKNDPRFNKYGIWLYNIGENVYETYHKTSCKEALRAMVAYTFHFESFHFMDESKLPNKRKWTLYFEGMPREIKFPMTNRNKQIEASILYGLQEYFIGFDSFDIPVVFDTDIQIEDCNVVYV